MSAALAPDLGSIRLAVDHALAAGEPDDVGWLLGALYPFLISHGHAREAYEWTERTLAQRDRLTSRALAEALSGGGEIARFVGELDRALELKEELARYDGDLQRPNWRVAILADLSEVALDQGDFDQARAYAEESAAAGGGPRASLCLAELALRRADPGAAELHARVALAGFQQGAFNYACALEILAEAARRRGDGHAARERFCDALRLSSGSATAAASPTVSTAWPDWRPTQATASAAVGSKALRRSFGCHVAGGRYGLPTPLEATGDRARRRTRDDGRRGGGVRARGGGIVA